MSSHERSLQAFDVARERHLEHLERLARAHHLAMAALAPTLSGSSDAAPPRAWAASERTAALSDAPPPRPAHPLADAPRVVGFALDPDAEPWLADHRPTHAIAVAPGAWMFDRLAAFASPDARPSGLEDAEVLGWLPVEGRCELRVEVVPLGPGRTAATLSVHRRAPRAALSRFEPRARAIVLTGGAPPELPALAPLVAPEPLPDPYDNVFLGPSFRLATRVVVGDNGATSWVEPARSGLPRGVLDVGLLDASLHAMVPRARRRWFPGLDVIGLPSAIPRLHRMGPAPERGVVRIELRLAGASADRRTTRAHVRYFDERGRCFMALDSTQVLLPSRVPHAQSDRFMRDRLPCPGVTTAHFDGRTTRLDPAMLAALDWLPGSIAHVYGIDPAAPLARRAEAIALKDHGAQRLGAHPRDVAIAADHASVAVGERRVAVVVARDGAEVVVRDGDVPATDGARA